MTLSIPVDGTNNESQWFKDGSPISGATNEIYEVAAVSLDDGGVYVLHITNMAASDLTLESEPIIVIPSSIVVFVPAPGLERGAELPIDRYRLISIPLILENKRPKDVLVDDLGEYDKTRWRFFEPIDDSTNFTEFPSTSEMSPGKAFWLIVRDPDKLIDTGAGTTVRTDREFDINLEPGWNYIGNPFKFPIPQDKITRQSDDPLNLWFYDTMWKHYTEELKPFEGYAVFNVDTTEVDILQINPDLSNVQRTSTKQGRRAGQDAAWSIRILAQSQGLRDVETVAAVASSASAAWDRLDRPEPPLVPGDYVSVYFAHPEWKKATARYSTDTRPLPQDGAVWPVEIVTARRDQVHLTFEGLSGVPAGYEVWLVDEVLGIRQDLRQTDTYTVVGGGRRDPRPLKLVVGRPGFVEGEVQAAQELPERFELYPNFPNPFNPSTTIRYGVPEASVVTLVVYDILGRQVALLERGQEQEAGYHAMIWDGRDDAGKQVASGVYFVRMQAGRFVQTQKMVLVK